MNKKLVALCLCVAILASALTAGTLAYFTDKDSAVNTMTLGNVNIIQNEHERGNGGLVKYVDDKNLLPAVYTQEEFAQTVNINGVTLHTGIGNIVDKIVTVTNEAASGAKNQDAYVRTLIAFETNAEYKAGTADVIRDEYEIFDTYIGTFGDFTILDTDADTKDVEPVIITVDGVKYIVAEKVYENPLAPGATTEPSLKQFFLSPDAGNEVSILFEDTYTILTLSQGTQVLGFENAVEALDTAFGDVETAVNDTGKLLVQEWFDAVYAAADAE